MKYEAIDTWNSPSLEHYGVKGMKWGVRKVVQRVGTGVRRLGGASVRVAKATARGLYGAGSAVRRFKNRRAIKSGNSNRILKRANKMTTQELNDATARVQLLNQIRQNGSANQKKTFGDKMVEGLQQKSVEMGKDYLKTSVESILAKEKPIVGIRRDAQVSIARKKKMLSLNNTSNDSSSSKERIKVTLRNGTRTTSKPLSSNRNLYRVPIKTLNTPVADIDKTTYRYIPRHSMSHSDVIIDDDFLAHYGVLGMKWGMRKAENRGDTYTYRSIGQRLKQRKVNRLQSQLRLMNSVKKNAGVKIDPNKRTRLERKITNQTNRLNDLKTRDKNRQRYAESTTVGAAVARGILLGPIMTGNWNRARASGLSVKAALLATPMSLLSTRSSEFATARMMNDADNAHKLKKHLNRRS